MLKLDQYVHQKQLYNKKKWDLLNWWTNHVLCFILIMFHDGGDGEIPMLDQIQNNNLTITFHATKDQPISELLVSKTDCHHWLALVEWSQSQNHRRMRKWLYRCRGRTVDDLKTAQLTREPHVAQPNKWAASRNCQLS